MQKNFLHSDSKFENSHETATRMCTGLYSSSFYINKRFSNHGSHSTQRIIQMRADEGVNA